MMADQAKNDPGLLALGRIVDRGSPDQELSARSAARLLFGAIGLAAAKYGVDEMQRACADIALSDEAWRTSFRRLPRRADGTVSEAISLIASMARGVLAMAGREHTRAALAFWATEADPAVWREIAPHD